MAISLNTTPGYITALSLGGKDYAVIAYREEADGTKTYLPANLDQQEHEKLRSLAWALFNTHDLKRKALNEPLFDGKFADARGLTNPTTRLFPMTLSSLPSPNPLPIRWPLLLKYKLTLSKPKTSGTRLKEYLEMSPLFKLHQLNQLLNPRRKHLPLPHPLNQPL